jgi:hypothetical protein
MQMVMDIGFLRMQDTENLRLLAVDGNMRT